MARKPEGTLRRGWTTDACATAATRAAATALLTGRFPDPVTITLPKGERPAFALAREELTPGMVAVAITFIDCRKVRQETNSDKPLRQSAAEHIYANTTGLFIIYRLCHV